MADEFTNACSRTPYDAAQEPATRGWRIQVLGSCPLPETTFVRPSPAQETAFCATSTVLGHAIPPHLARQGTAQVGPCPWSVSRYNGYMRSVRLRNSPRKLAQWATWYTLTKEEFPLCVYCGMLSDSLDHYPPISSSPLVGVLLPACLECNRFASDLYPYDFTKRVEHVKNKIRRKHANVLRTPIWSADELDTMSGLMREEVRIWRERRRIVHARLAWDVASYLRQLVATRNSAATDAGCDRTRDIVLSLLGLCRGRTGPFKSD